MSIKSRSLSLARGLGAKATKMRYTYYMAVHSCKLCKWAMDVLRKCVANIYQFIMRISPEHRPWRVFGVSFVFYAIRSEMMNRGLAFFEWIHFVGYSGFYMMKTTKCSSTKHYLMCNYLLTISIAAQLSENRYVKPLTMWYFNLNELWWMSNLILTFKTIINTDIVFVWK